MSSPILCTLHHNTNKLQIKIPCQWTRLYSDKSKIIFYGKPPQKKTHCRLGIVQLNLIHLFPQPFEAITSSSGGEWTLTDMIFSLLKKCQNQVIILSIFTHSRFCKLSRSHGQNADCIQLNQHPNHYFSLQQVGILKYNDSTRR